MSCTRQLLVSAFALLGATPLSAQILDWGVSRGPVSQQTMDNMAPAVAQSWDFEFFLDATAFGDVTSVLVKGPGFPAAGTPLQSAGPDLTNWFYVESFATSAAMDARFAPGSVYNLEVTGNVGALSQPLTLPARNTPIVPFLTNGSFSTLRVFDESIANTITWNAPGSVGLVSFALIDTSNGNRVVGFEAFSSATQTTIDPFVLPSTRCFVGGLAFINFAQPAGNVFGLPGSVVDANINNIEAGTFSSVASAQSSRNPGGVNPEVLQADPNGAVLGNLWQPSVDHSTFATTAILDVLLISAAPIQAPSPFGMLLVDPGAAFAPFLFTPAGQPWQLSIPYNCAIYGVTVPTQAGAVFPSGFLQVTNALDVTLGAF